MKLLPLLACALLLPSIAHAGDAALDDTLKAFSRCDASFFSSLKVHSDAWKAYAPLQQDKDAAWIAVANRGSRSGNSVALGNLPPVAGMKLLSYFDESTNLGNLGYYFYWGFMVDGRPDDVAKRLSPLLEKPALLKKIDTAYVRSELRFRDSWLSIEPMPGSAPGKSRVERVLLLEPEGAQTRLSCSVQGAVDAALLVQLRPDIAPAEYPQTRLETAIGDVAVPQDVLKKLDSPLLAPKFKSLTYTYTTKQNGPLKRNPVSVVLEAEGGLLNKTEKYGSFQVERLTKADLIQLKAKMIGLGDDEVLQTSELEFKAPQSWSPGQTLSARLLMKHVPAKPNDEPTKTQTQCTVGERMPARQVFASLPGDAIKLACIQGDNRTSSVFIEDLGVAVTLESTSGSDHDVYEITALEVVR
ncbi:hypothetical protein [Pseudomonas sp. K2I15]|uniref:hypothetical protein n=1 Tax=unclassified Pseudomonas TaxID=196821 RepID=UPI000B4C672E|nr:hypothetical protein [Pseudomonas sp. K2I15]OWP69643.1 hypothetical protein CEC48_22085 [Pseudomonas sp. K2I15]